MDLVDRQGSARERRFALTLLRGANRDDRALIRFTHPGDIKGTGLLVWEHAKAESERFLFLPALGRVRRIAGSEAQESFAGSDFSYEDLTGQDLDAYTYELLHSDDAGAFRLQARAKHPRSRYPTTISLVSKETLIVMHAELLDGAGQRRKTYDVRRREKVQGIWTALEMMMATDRERTRTTLTVVTARYDVGLKEEDFSRRELERGGR